MKAASRGFTLIEVLVALLVVAIAYTGVAQAIAQFVDQRLLLVERHTSHRVAWNRLIEQYAIANGLNVGEREFAEREGVVTARGGRWHWQISEQEAAGDDLIRYEVEVTPQDGGSSSHVTGSLVAFFTQSSRNGG